MNISKYIGLLLTSGLLVSAITGCTNLEEDVLGANFIDDGTATTGTLVGTYNQLGKLTNDIGYSWGMQEYPSDELQGPTRGADWGDFGRWRQLHQHQWTPIHTSVTDTWDELNIGVYRATQVIANAKGDTQIEGEARFLRALFMWEIVDLYGKVPFREVADSPDADPKVFTRIEATAFIIQDLEYVISKLPSAVFTKANKEAAEALLARVYLNKAVYEQAPNAPAGPFNFEKASMDKAIENLNKVIASNKYSIQPKGEYFKMFYWNNTMDSKESIFGIDNTVANQPASIRSLVLFTTHYKQYISGWNGGTTLGDFYDYFDKTKDERSGGEMAGFTDKTGMRTGFLIGPQHNEKGEALLDRTGNPLSFTREVDLLYAGEANGIRVIKYPLDPEHTDQPANDFIPLRYSDVILMKAEAILRGGTDPMGQTAVDLVNSIRTNRGLDALQTVDLDELLKERGRELYWEGLRRSDQIRFGTFLNPMDNKPAKSADHFVVYPIPQKAVSTNVNLTQNVGY